MINCRIHSTILPLLECTDRGQSFEPSTTEMFPNRAGAAQHSDLALHSIAVFLVTCSVVVACATVVVSAPLVLIINDDVCGGAVLW